MHDIAAAVELKYTCVQLRRNCIYRQCGVHIAILHATCTIEKEGVHWKKVERRCVHWMCLWKRVGFESPQYYEPTIWFLNAFFRFYHLYCILLAVSNRIQWHSITIRFASHKFRAPRKCNIFFLFFVSLNARRCQHWPTSNHTDEAVYIILLNCMLENRNNLKCNACANNASTQIAIACMNWQQCVFIVSFNTGYHIQCNCCCCCYIYIYICVCLCPIFMCLINLNENAI